ncbi:MAG: A/G-specific adenine glycosylase [Brevibacterium sp.]|uniref:A/G-specific adenine glycosylase n=1 Tax=Brevibacterium sandarakinum TaxID=629680 RepID=UPI002651D3D4|nr:A/G-specific adenine glycosylase [Brevibacterium sandarakinum]MDN5585133.1 A/G-specific adenine glycosylase [Brevibacterium sp.]MDN5656780.1 A/G-specific adenine glycosylase [Brevibacterium sandarakinum]
MTHRASAESRSSRPGSPFPAVADSDIDRVRDTIIAWFETAARPLPWRDAGTSAWAVLVSEIMSQQTPVARVEPRWREWMQKWPTPSDLAEAPTAEVLHRWDRLGYPRRALRLQEAARVIAEDLDGRVPQSAAELERLPGIGSYTAAAVASFAHGERTTVLDTNVRRVLIRLFAGRDRPSASPGRAETEWASQFVPETDHARWNAGVMEFGALVCTARNPDCESCPLSDICAWQKAGRPASAVKPKTQKWAGTDRQLRGAIMDVLKSAHEQSDDGDNAGSVSLDLLTASTVEVDPELLDSLPPQTSTKLDRVRDLSADPDRIMRLIDGLVSDGLAAREDSALRLPG